MLHCWGHACSAGQAAGFWWLLARLLASGGFWQDTLARRTTELGILTDGEGAVDGQVVGEGVPVHRADGDPLVVGLHRILLAPQEVHLCSAQRGCEPDASARHQLACAVSFMPSIWQSSSGLSPASEWICSSQVSVWCWAIMSLSLNTWTEII